MSKVYQDTVGLEIILDLQESLSGATSCLMYVRKPSGATDTWTAAVTESTKITYTTVADDLDEDGRYEITPYVALASWQGYGETVFLDVYGLYA